MKTSVNRFSAVLALLLVSHSLFGQTSIEPGKSYVKIEKVTVSGKVTSTDVDNLTYTGKQTVINYLDKRGRTFQTVAFKGSPSENDIIQAMSYDNYGRQVKSYLPFTLASNEGDFDSLALEGSSEYSNSNQYNFYKAGNTVAKVADSNYPYAETAYESSPLNRIKQQGAPGSDWQLGSGHQIEYDYGVNSANDVRKMTVSSGQLSGTSSYYPASQLSKQVLKGADHSGSAKTHTVETYTDKLGRKILSRQYDSISATETALETYYVYDDLGKLRYVLPPEAVDNITGNIGELIFYYEYDKRGRLTEKLSPGADTVYYVYDSYDRVVLTQNGEQRNDDQWTYAIYDNLHRPEETGVYTDTRSLSAIRTDLEDETDYTPSSRTAHTYTYYDDYSWSGKHSFDATNNISGYSDSDGDTRYFDNMVGMVTGTKVLVLDEATTANWITTTFYYDDKLRVIEVLKDLYPSGSETVASKYDFTDNVVETRHYQSFDGETTTVKKWYTYDHGGRLTKTEQEITGDTGNGKITLAELEYNELGQVIEKDLHGGTAQSIDYRYNIRGWLTSINNSNLTSDSGVTNDDSTDDFGMELYYNSSPTGLSTTTLYGGNITAMIWGASSESNKRAYLYEYDKLGQITKADYKEYTTSWTDQSNAYDLSSISYDLNGNITALERKDNTGSDLHDLNYTYSTNSNQISSITDNETSTSYTGYTYDNNGNMTDDKMRGFEIDYYPTLNLVKTVSKGSDEVTYIYDATGNKLKKYNSTTAIYYAGNFIYDNNKDLDYILNEYGSVAKSGTSYAYQYDLTDHLGNVRVVVSSSGTVLQTNNYYPFGLVFALNNLDKNSYLYGSKEYQNYNIDGTSEAFFDFGARMYDPVLGRWGVPDPAEQFTDITPYGYCANSPLIYTDPDGEWIFTFLAGIFCPPLLPVALAADIGGIINVATNIDNISSLGQFVGYYGIGAAAAATGGVAGQVAAGAVGTIGFMGGALTSGAAGISGGFISGAGNSWMGGANFGGGLIDGFNAAVIGGLTGGVIGGVSGGITAINNGGNFWSGKGATFDALAQTTGDQIRIGEGLEYSNEYAQKFSDDNFGTNIAGLNELQADGTIPNGYSTRGDVVLNRAGHQVRGSTVYLGTGKGSNVLLYKAAFTSKEQLYFTMGHEYLHVAYNHAGIGFTKALGRAKHASIYKWEAYQAKLWGFRTSYYWNRYLAYKQYYNPAFDYGKFGFYVLNIKPW